MELTFSISTNKAVQKDIVHSLNWKLSKTE